MGLRDLLTPTALLLIEWPSRGAGLLPPPDLEIQLDYPAAGERTTPASGGLYSSWGQSAATLRCGEARIRLAISII